MTVTLCTLTSIKCPLTLFQVRPVQPKSVRPRFPVHIPAVSWFPTRTDTFWRHFRWHLPLVGRELRQERQLPILRDEQTDRQARLHRFKFNRLVGKILYYFQKMLLFQLLACFTGHLLTVSFFIFIFIFTCVCV